MNCISYREEYSVIYYNTLFNTSITMAIYFYNRTVEIGYFILIR